MTANGIGSLPFYYADRARSYPTAARVFEFLDPLCSMAVFHAGDPLTVSAPAFDLLQRQILSLLEVSAPTSRSSGLPEHHAERVTRPAERRIIG